MIIFFAIYKQNFLNYNQKFLINRTQFYTEDSTLFLAQKSNLIEELFDLFYEYLLKYLKSPKLKTPSGAINPEIFKNLELSYYIVRIDCKYFSKPKVRNIMAEKTSIFKRAIDCICLIHNENEFKSIIPHPKFQDKGLSQELLELELDLLSTIQSIILFIDWEKINELKEIFKYLINKIIHQEKEGIKTLKIDEYTYHLGLYRCFLLLMNSFCFNYAFNNEKTIFESIQFFKKTFFESKTEVENLVNIILKDYYKFFGLISGAQNNFFNYYDSVSQYPRIYFLINIY
jgi:hypothetical protein